MTELILVALKVCVVAMIVAIGMSSRLADVLWLLRQPALLARSLFAMYVLVPLAAFLVVRLLPVTPGAKAALLVLSVSAGAPLLPRKLLFLSNHSYVFGLAVISSLLAIVVAPAWVALLARYFGLEAELPATAVATIIAKGFLVPVGLGMAFHAFRPALSERIAQRVLALAGIGLLVGGLGLLVVHFDVFRQVRASGMLALALVMAMGLAIGHAMGGPDTENRTALAIACATRHFGLALLVATRFPGARVAVLIAAYLLVMLAVTIPYLEWRKRRGRARTGPVADAATRSDRVF
jgi:predicted Na+-dependent transporter